MPSNSLTQVYLSEVDHKILDHLYHYGFVWSIDLSKVLGVSPSFTNRRLLRLVKKRFLIEHKLKGERRKKTYALSESGFQFLKDSFGYNEQYISDRDFRLDNLTDGFLRHECLITQTIVKFRERGQKHVHDRRSFLSYLPDEARRARKEDGISRMEIPSKRIGSSHRADEILYIKPPGKRPTAILLEVDRGTESERDRYDNPVGQVADMFEFYIDAYREKFFRRYFGNKVKPIVLFLISTPWNGATRKQNFITLWKELAKGDAPGLPLFLTLDEFSSQDFLLPSRTQY